MTRMTAVVCLAGSALLAGAVDRPAEVAGDLTVTVLDRAFETPLPDVDVTVTRGPVAQQGVTGPKGSVTFRALPAGDVRVSVALEGYIRRPEIADTTIRAGANDVGLTLLAESQDLAYFKRVGEQIERASGVLPADRREAFFKSEWDRVKLLKFEFQMPVVGEITSGRTYLANDTSFQLLVKRREIGR